MNGRVDAAQGVYGFRLEGLEPSPHMVVTVSSHAPHLVIARSQNGWSQFGTPDVVQELLDDGHMAVFKSSDLYVFSLATHVSDDELLHPWIVPAICHRASELGRIVLHGGVLACDGLAIAVIGDREAGKSTLMASAARARFAERGNGAPAVEVLADDLVVLDGDTVYAGPRCLDLRPSSAPMFPDVQLHPSRNDSRFRVYLPQCSGHAKLAGFVMLSWGSDLSIQQIPVVRRISLLADYMSVGRKRRDYDAVLELAAKPVWLLQRPKDPDLLGATLELLVNLMRRESAGAGGSRDLHAGDLLAGDPEKRPAS